MRPWAAQSGGWGMEPSFPTQTILQFHDFIIKVSKMQSPESVLEHGSDTTSFNTGTFCLHVLLSLLKSERNKCTSVHIQKLNTTYFHKNWRLSFLNMKPFWMSLPFSHYREWVNEMHTLPAWFKMSSVVLPDQLHHLSTQTVSLNTLKETLKALISLRWQLIRHNHAQL